LVFTIPFDSPADTASQTTQITPPHCTRDRTNLSHHNRPSMCHLFTRAHNSFHQFLETRLSNRAL